MESHYLGLQKYASEQGVELDFYEFHVFHLVVKSIKLHSSKLFWKQFRNIVAILKLLWNRDTKIVLGISPVNFHFIWIYYFLIRKNKVFYHTSWPDWSTGYNGLKFKILKSTWQKAFGKGFCGVYCVSGQTRASLLENFSVSASVNVVYHAIKLDKGFPTKRKENRFLFVGRLVREKGISTILRLAKKYHQYEFLIVGSGPMVNDIENCDLKNVKFLGYKSKEELREIYQSSSVLILPSEHLGKWQELFGIVIIEAMQHGVITFATNHIGPREIITHMRDGFLVTERDFEKEFDLNIQIIVENEDLRDKMRVSAMARAHFFNEETIAELWKEVVHY